MIASEQELSLTAGPWIGMDDTPSMGAQDARRARELLNMYGPASAVGGDVISRPRFTQVTITPAQTRTGTITSSANTVTGVGTLFLTELAIGDLITTATNSGIVTAIANNTSATVVIADDAVARAFTYTPAGVTGGPIYGVWQHTLTTGVYHRLLLVKTTSALIDGAGAGRYRFLDGAVRIRLIEWDPSNATHPFTDRTSASMNGVALTAATRIYATTFANSFILTDGTNRPRKIDATWVLTNLTDGNYAFTGPLTVYYGKLFGVDASDAITMRWSEEADPDTGYGTGTSDNSWSLRQTSGDQITVLIGTNQALFAFRQNSTAIITGAANSDFRSSGSVDAVQSIGTRSPDAVALVGASVVFLDQYGRPGRIQIGYGYLPLWKRIQETLRGVGKTAALSRAAWCRYDPVTNLIKFGLRWTSSSTTNEKLLVFDADSWECFGTHTLVSDTNRTAIDHAYSGGNPQSTSPMLDANLLPIHVVASGSTSDISLYWQEGEDVPANAAQDVVGNASNVTVQGSVSTPLMGGDPKLEKHFDRIIAGIRNVGGATTGYPSVKLQYRTAYADYTAAAAMTFSGTGHAGFVTYDGATYKVESAGKLNRQASRYIQCKFTNDVTGNPATRFTLDTVTVVATPTDQRTERR